MKHKQGKEVVCQFFGIEVSTKNPNIARVLTQDVGEFLDREIRHLTHPKNPAPGPAQLKPASRIGGRKAAPALVP